MTTSHFNPQAYLPLIVKNNIFIFNLIACHCRDLSVLINQSLSAFWGSSASHLYRLKVGVTPVDVNGGSLFYAAVAEIKMCSPSAGLKQLIKAQKGQRKDPWELLGVEQY